MFAIKAVTKAQLQWSLSVMRLMTGFLGLFGCIGITTHLVVVLLFVRVLVGATLFKKAQGSVISHRIGNKFGSIVD